MTNSEKIARFRELSDIGYDSLREAFKLWDELSDAGISLRTVLGAAEYDKLDIFWRKHCDDEPWR